MLSLIKSTLKSFQYAWDGIRFCFGVEKTLTIMLFISIISIIGGFYFKITNTEWLFILILIAGVFSLELFNTAIERFLDLFYPGKNETVKNIKDLIAGGVAIVSIGAGIIGGIIFIPKILILFCLLF